LVHVGNNRRDFETLIKGLDIVYIKYPDLQVDLIGVSTVKERIPERPYLKIHNFLGDLDYRRILQSCNFALLSLEDGGSSNSLLELCSCGLPIIHTSMPNVEDYIKTHFSETFAKGDSDRLAELCIYFLKNPEIRKTYSSAARDNALMFDWKLLKKKFIELIDYY